MTQYIYPTDLPISSPYGPRDGGFHYGIDFSDGREGHPIHAIADGVVTYQAFEPAPSFGNTVTLTHAGGMKSGYGHMLAPALVGVGENVKQGQIIGYVGNTGGSTGPHLHLWMGATPNGPGTVNPADYLGNSEGFLMALSDAEQNEILDYVRQLRDGTPYTEPLLTGVSKLRGAVGDIAKQYGVDPLTVMVGRIRNKVGA